MRETLKKVWIEILKLVRKVKRIKGRKEGTQKKSVIYFPGFDDTRKKTTKKVKFSSLLSSFYRFFQPGFFSFFSFFIFVFFFYSFFLKQEKETKEENRENNTKRFLFPVGMEVLSIISGLLFFSFLWVMRRRSRKNWQKNISLKQGE